MSKESYNILTTVKTVTISAVDVGSSVIGTVIFLMVSPLCSLSLIYCVLLFHRRYKQLQERASKSTVSKLPIRIWVQPVPEVSQAEAIESSETQTDDTADRTQDEDHVTGGLNQEDRTSPASTTLLNDDHPGAEKPWVSSGECIICMEDYITQVSRVMRLPCYHEFHVECITRWLTTRKKTCPICKYDITLGKRVPMSSSPSSSIPTVSSEVAADTDLESGISGTSVESSRCSMSYGNETSRLLEPNVEPGES